MILTVFVQFWKSLATRNSISSWYTCQSCANMPQTYSSLFLTCPSQYSILFVWTVIGNITVKCPNYNLNFLEDQWTRNSPVSVFFLIHRGLPPFSHADKSWSSMFAVLWWEWEVWSQEYFKNEKEKMVFPYYHDIIEIPVPSRWEHKTWTDLFICDVQICASSRWIWHCLLNGPWPF